MDMNEAKERVGLMRVCGETPCDCDNGRIKIGATLYTHNLCGGTGVIHQHEPSTVAVSFDPPETMTGFELAP